MLQPCYKFFYTVAVATAVESNYLPSKAELLASIWEAAGADVSLTRLEYARPYTFTIFSQSKTKLRERQRICHI